MTPPSRPEPGNVLCDGQEPADRAAEAAGVRQAKREVVDVDVDGLRVG
jgi:hypothetical protein